MLRIVYCNYIEIIKRFWINFLYNFYKINYKIYLYFKKIVVGSRLSFSLTCRNLARPSFPSTTALHRPIVCIPTASYYRVCYIAKLIAERGYFSIVLNRNDSLYSVSIQRTCALLLWNSACNNWLNSITHLFFAVRLAPFPTALHSCRK
jgi:hypothetical protein